MKGNFRIASDYLEEIDACSRGLYAFQKAYPQGGEYQEILDRCCAEGYRDYAGWLLSKVGATDDVRVYEDFVSDQTLDIVFAGGIEFKRGAIIRMLIAGKGIKAGEGIEAGWSIEAGEGIKAGWGIEAGEGIKASAGIEAGGDFGIFAGLKVEVSLWEHYAKVIAKSKPENLISGYWEQLPEGESHD